MTRVKISGDALTDLENACNFYEAREVGAGEFFAARIKRDINNLEMTGAFIDEPTETCIVS